MFANLPPLGLFQTQTLGGVYSAVSLILRSNDDCRARRVPRASGNATRSPAGLAFIALRRHQSATFLGDRQGDKLALLSKDRRCNDGEAYRMRWNESALPNA